MDSPSASIPPTTRPYRAAATRPTPIRPLRPPSNSGLLLGAHLGLVRALLRLVVLERLRRVDVPERRMARHEVLCDRDVEALREHRAHCCHLHLAEARQGGEATPEIGAVRRF